MPKILENVKEDILTTARHMVLVEHLPNVSIREIASRCNISTGTIYNYFNSKQDIIVSITWQEWYLALKRIDIHNNSNINYMEKLKNIFIEIRNFLNMVHNIQHEHFFEQIEIEKFMKMQKDKKVLHEVLSSKVCGALSSTEISEQNSLVCSIIIKIFCSYALYSEISFEDLKPYIEKLIH
ncbi:TetR/AcrR family transcriptional regulator [Romboutsia sp.]|uniref:TetR/AcrR family transcriptional regulator n=1 Tax=Romboutsia sp. TaxID=1965302 RepID=UPI003F2BEA0F